MRKNNIVLNLKREYFEAIQRGEKKEEYRIYNDYWKRRLIGREYENIEFRLGYPKRGDHARSIVRQYTGYTIKTITHRHFGCEPVEVFAIKIMSPGNEEPKQDMRVG